MKVQDAETILSKVDYSAGDLTAAIQKELNAWQQQNKMKRLWEHDKSLWTNTDEAEWMGWLDVSLEEEKELPRILALSKEINAKGYEDIILLGMGGSSLCPAMLAETFGHIDGYPHLHILDSTDPEQIRHLQASVNLKKTFFVVSSKSGSTLEPTIFKAYFYHQLQNAFDKPEVGEHFMAITDPGTVLEKTAKQDHFKAIFYGVPSIGGRYSALSNFGMVPAGLMGVNVPAFLRHADQMRQACLPDVPAQENPGLLLGVILGVCAKHHKDKITLVVSPGIQSLGAWLEQLLAESTGKQGKGLIPIDLEPLGKPMQYGNDRVFVYVRLQSAPDQEQDKAIDALQEAGFVVVRLYLQDKMHLGGELFRWEIATDVAGSILEIDPFNQPDVEESKVLTTQLTDQFEKTHRLTTLEPFFSDKEIALYTDTANQQAIQSLLKGKPSVENYLRAHLSRIQAGDYVDLSAFLEMSVPHFETLQKGRVAIRNETKAATCLGFGPRFLHSTGQDYKGGPNTGVFLQITTHYKEDLPVPNHAYTFGTVITAQAQGDFTVLAKRKRRVLHIHLKRGPAEGLVRLVQLINDALKGWKQ